MRGPEGFVFLDEPAFFRCALAATRNRVERVLREVLFFVCILASKPESFSSQLPDKVCKLRAVRLGLRLRRGFRVVVLLLL